jgi:hypothetical protein
MLSHMQLVQAQLYELVGRPVIDRLINCKYLNSSISALHWYFVPFLSMPWAQFHLLMVSRAIS